MLKTNLQTDDPATGHPPSSLVSVRRFRADLNVVPSTVWRWTQRGWLPKPTNIGGRLYLPAEAIQKFMERAARGEFAGGTKPPPRVFASGDNNEADA